MSTTTDGQSDPTYGYCNSCGEEMREGDTCCEDGEWAPSDDEGPDAPEGDKA